MSNKTEHLNMIQGVIERMGRNSFSLKGWAVGSMIAVFSFAGDSSSKAAIITLIPIMVFWVLDSYYLVTERKYRRLYDTVRQKKKDEDIDFSMSTANINIDIDKAHKFTVLNAMFTKSTLPFYVACIIITVLVYFIPQ